MNYLRAGLQRNQSNRTATRSTWFDTVEFTGFRIGQDSAGDAEFTIALSPTAGEGVLNFTCDHNWFISPVFTDGTFWAPHVYASL